jgi:hypothetical protein
MRRLLLLILLPALAGCAGPRSYSRGTLSPLRDAFACAQDQLRELGYRVSLVDSIGGLLQGHREITGLRETARRGAAAATEVITAGLTEGPLDRFDELTVFVFTRHYPQGNTVEVTAGLLTVSEETREQGAPTDAAKRDARTLLDVCASAWS